MDESLIGKIYGKLGDDVSKSIFSRRLMYSLTGDSRFVREMALDMPEGKRFYRLLDMAEHAGLVIFGAGTWGTDLYRVTKDYPWKCFVDSNPRMDKSEGLPVISYREFIRNYQNETVVISSRLYYKSMYAQLVQSGIKPDRIINAGSMLDELSRKQYFDLEELKPQEEEVFIDAGGFDGMTSVYFQKWYLESGGGWIETLLYMYLSRTGKMLQNAVRTWRCTRLNMRLLRKDAGKKKHVWVFRLLQMGHPGSCLRVRHP